MKFRKKPVTIEARLFNGTDEDIAQWCGGRLRKSVTHNEPDKTRYYMEIPTLEGTMIASAGDWIIQGVSGEFYPCKPEIFDATYESVE